MENKCCILRRLISGLNTGSEICYYNTKDLAVQEYSSLKAISCSGKCIPLIRAKEQQSEPQFYFQCPAVISDKNWKKVNIDFLQVIDNFTFSDTSILGIEEGFAYPWFRDVKQGTIKLEKEECEGYDNLNRFCFYHKYIASRADFQEIKRYDAATLTPDEYEVLVSISSDGLCISLDTIGYYLAGKACDHAHFEWPVKLAMPHWESYIEHPNAEVNVDLGIRLSDFCIDEDTRKEYREKCIGNYNW